MQRNWGAERQERVAAFLGQCRMWAGVTDHARRQGRPIHAADAWIAATALTLDVPLITHNRADYAGVARLRLLPDSS